MQDAAKYKKLIFFDQAKMFIIRKGEDISLPPLHIPPLGYKQNSEIFTLQVISSTCHLTGYKIELNHSKRTFVFYPSLSFQRCFSAL